MSTPRCTPETSPVGRCRAPLGSRWGAGDSPLVCLLCLAAIEKPAGRKVLHSGGLGHRSLTLRGNQAGTVPDAPCPPGTLRNRPATTAPQTQLAPLGRIPRRRRRCPARRRARQLGRTGSRSCPSSSSAPWRHRDRSPGHAGCGARARRATMNHSPRRRPPCSRRRASAARSSGIPRRSRRAAGWRARGPTLFAGLLLVAPAATRTASRWWRRSWSPLRRSDPTGSRALSAPLADRVRYRQSELLQAIVVAPTPVR